MERYYFLDNRESDTDTPFMRTTSGFIHLVELFTDEEYLLLWYPIAIIAESEDGFSGSISGFDGQSFPLSRIFYKIGENIMEELYELPFIKLNIMCGPRYIYLLSLFLK